MDYKDGEILGNRNVVETQVIHIYSEKKIPSLSIMSISVTISTFFPFLFVCFLFSLVRSGGAEQVHRRNLLRSRSSNASPLQPLIFTKNPLKIIWIVLFYAAVVCYHQTASSLSSTKDQHPLSPTTLISLHQI